MKIQHIVSATVVLAAFTYAVNSNALELRVDFGDDSGGPGGNWNTLGDGTPNTTVTDLTDFISGLGSGVDVTTSGWSGEASDNSWIAGAKDWVTGDDTGDDYYYSGGGTPDAVFSGLTGSSYKVEVLAVRPYDFPSNVDIQVQGSFGDITYQGFAKNGDDWRQGVDGTGIGANPDPGDWVIWNSVAPTAGSIAIEFSEITEEAAFAAIRITEAESTETASGTPEPSTCVLALLGLVGFATTRRSRRRRC